jgi:DNA mismatch repair protein MutS2
MPSNLLDFYNIDKDPLSLRTVLARAQSECLFHLAKEQFTQLSKLDLAELAIQRSDLSVFEANGDLQTLFRQACNSHPLGDDFFPLVGFLGKGKFFSLGELNLFAKFCELIAQLRKDKHLKNFLSPEINLEPLRQSFIKPLRLLVDPDGKEHFANHPLLRPLLNDIETLDVKIRETIKRVMGSNDFKERLDSNQFDIIKGRFVLCINTFKYALSLGSITDRSSSGNILYIEPREIRQINNQRENLYLDFLEKLDAIIFELSEQVNLFATTIFALKDDLLRLDYLQALNKLHTHFNLHPPKIEESRQNLNLYSVFHPGIRDCIKNDFVFSREKYSSFCLSGTNTGGKTAFLKSVAINVLFAHWGFNVPALSAEIPLFESIFFINSENEDLDHGLSSFSGEVTELIEILKSTNGRSLVIVDEIFNSTSSDEASSLAYALLQFAKQKHNLSFLISTHHEELKRKLSTKKDVLSAHVEFNRQTLKPTYKVILGRPGSSEAINIFQSICNSLNFDHKEILRFIDSNVDEPKAEAEIKNLDILAESYQQKIAIIEKQEKSLIDKERKLDEMKANFFEKEIDDFKSWLNEEREIFQSEVKLKKSKIAIEELTQKTKKKVDTLHDEFNISEVRTQDLSVEANSNLGQTSIVIGNQYFSPFLKTTVKIEQFSKAKNQYLVTCQNKKLWLSPLHIGEKRKAPQEKTKTYVSVSLGREATLSVDLRGYRVDDFEEEVIKRLSELHLSQAPYIEIIHGHGDGKLKSWLRSFLSKNKDRYRFEISEFNDGSTTIYLID